jgi:hypothetical protein
VVPLESGMSFVYFEDPENDPVGVDLWETASSFTLYRAPQLVEFATLLCGSITPKEMRVGLAC